MPTDLAESSASNIDPFSSWESTSVSDYSHSEDRNEPFIAQPSNSRPTTLNTGSGNQRDAYWFAHAADPPQEKPKRAPKMSSLDQDEASGRKSDTEKESPTDASSKGRGVMSPTQFESKEDASPLSHKDREERMRQFKERLEEDRSRRLQELEQASAHAQKIRELQEEDRKRKIEELRSKDLERRHAVEERKRQIWEAEQERKEAILRRNLDREAKIEARRNAQRNSMSFAFGSSTPRTLDLDTGFVTYYRTAGNVMVVNGKNPDEKDMEYYKRRPPSADILDARQELTPSPREFDQHIVETNLLSSNLEPSKDHVKQPYRRSFAGMSSDETKACLTMTESSLDSPLCFVKQMPFFYQSGLSVGEDLMTRSMITLSSSVARGRRRTDLTPTIPSYRDLSLRSNSPANQTKRAVSMSRLDLLSQPRRRTIDSSSAAPSSNTSMSKSMFNLANSRRVRKGVGDRDTGMSRSMMHLISPPPTPPPRSTTRTNRPRTVPLSQSNKLLSKSMMHLTPPPRPNRATQLRALAAARKEGENSSVSVPGRNGTHGPHLAVTGTGKEISQSPSRPRSSMSIASEKSATSSHQSTVSMRVRSAPRRPRPASIAGTTPDTPPQPPPRQSRTAERKVPVNATPPTRPNRAKSAGPVNDAEAKEPQSKPPPVPKPVAVPIAKPLLPADDQTEVKIADAASPNANSEQPPQAEEVVGEEQQNSSPTNKPRITSEEAAKAALAEKRRLAREQVEREAELERQRQEQLRREEEEQKKREEEEQRKMEEEAARLAEALRQQEEEKLRKAIEEQEKLEEELRLQREEEAKQKAEREEQEKKAKEEAEKQRKELEEKLIKEEAERAERKKRVEQIMKRTRGKTAGQNSGGSSQENSVKGEVGESGNSDGEREMEVSAMQAVENNDHQLNGQSESEGQSSSALEEDLNYSSASAADHAATVNTKNDHNIMLDSAPIVQSEKLGNVIVESVNIQELNSDPFGSVAQTNGYKSEETHFTQHINPDEKINPLVENLLDFDPLSSNSIEKMNTSPSPDFNGLIDFSSAANTATNQNEIFLNNTDDINSNRMTANPFISFEENANMKQESTVTDLLS